MADGQDQDQNQDRAKQLGVCYRGDIGWGYIQPGNRMGKLGSQVVNCCGEGWMEDSMVASNIGMLMWSTDKLHKDKLLD